VLQLVDHYGATLVAFILAIGELYAFCYIYGVERVCKDIEFMLGFRPNVFWQVCWRYLTPGLMTLIVLYTLWRYEAPKDGGQDYPPLAHVIGWLLTTLGLIQVPLFAIYKIHYSKGITLWEVRLIMQPKSLATLNFHLDSQRVKASFAPTSTWGPRNATLRRRYHESLNYSD
jgi:solute carrier family 6 (neurotransmitter transporter, glycine) member 5/9